MSLGMIANQIAAEAVAPDATVHKWHVFEDIKRARHAVGATDRALTILHALLSFHTETALYGDSQLIVWPSNEALIARANGMSPATLRRHLSNLVDCGLIIRRDSPNGKRYARKGDGGDVEQAYGFDLAPIVARAAEFKELAKATNAERTALRLVKERLTICRRDVVKMIGAGMDESIPGNWLGFQSRYQSIVTQLPRTGPRQVLEAIAADLEALWSEIRSVLESFVNSRNLSANESQIERHIQNTNPDSKSESESGLGKLDEASGKASEPNNVRSFPKREIPLSIVLEACSNVRWLAKSGSEIRNWRDFAVVAELARPVLGISPSAWEDAKIAMGEGPAAVTLAVIYQKQDAVRSPGGYLRNLTERAKEGKFSVLPMVMALLRARLDTAKFSGSGVGEAERVLDSAEKTQRTEKRLEISAALQRSLAKGK